jgi:alkanesulfonate monooxygenase SsuD/methylene tetrahydromethanopterin reductase-like flavin-dependent oxidoreductase (luciferase family)
MGQAPVHQEMFSQLILPELGERPRQLPHPPIWRAASSGGSVRECGRLGAPMMTARIPLARVRERMDLYEAGLAESSLDAATRQQRREEAAVWRFVHVAESQAQAEDELGAALFETRRHMVHARATHNPVDYHVEPSRINPWNDPQVSHEDGVRYSLETSAFCGTAKRVADQVAELRDAGAHHVLCQMTCGYLPHAQVMESMRRFGEDVIPRFR